PLLRADVVGPDAGRVALPDLQQLESARGWPRGLAGEALLELDVGGLLPLEGGQVEGGDVEVAGLHPDPEPLLRERELEELPGGLLLFLVPGVHADERAAARHPPWLLAEGREGVGAEVEG